MMRLVRIGVLVAAVICPALALSQDSEETKLDLLKAAEMPAHRSLMRRIADDADGVSAFTTDGCSGGMSAGWSFVTEELPELVGSTEGDLPWRPCCVTHDRVYHTAGGTTDADTSYAARLTADEALRVCVIETGEAQKEQMMDRLGLSENQIELGYRILARSMYNAVRLGGGPCSRLPWRWGYGYPHC